jgi:elongator complex protein 3
MLDIFNKLKTEKDVAQLKRFLMRDKNWIARILSVRKKLNNKVDNSEAMPNNSELLALYKEMVAAGDVEENKNAEQMMKRLKVRSNSGVAVISLLTKPYACPGRCIYCPTEKNMPKSYLSREPAAARALLHRFDPYKQITGRLRALAMNGHPTDKIEMILIGGTFNYYPKDYQEWFVKESFRACNNWQTAADKIIPSDHNLSLAELQKINETTGARIIGLSIETRPDYVNFSELNWLRYLGVTKIEIGVQHLEDDVLDFNKRGMTAKSIAESSEILRAVGLKLVYHMMPNLPKSTPEKDVQMFKDLYNSKDHHPDMLKVYPCMILKGSVLYKLYTRQKIDYKPYDDETLTKVLADCEVEVQEYTRIIRMIRDIPADYILDGSKKSNMREDVDAYQKRMGRTQKDIRAREVRDKEIDPNDFELTETWYNTEHGRECFLQFQNKKDNLIAGFLRLRLQDTFFNNELEKYDNLKVLTDSALVRELHVYGTLKQISEKGNQSQHTGMGRKLLAKAEEISKREGYKKVSIISGVGVREYYKKNGYSLDGTYMVKML